MGIPPGVPVKAAKSIGPCPSYYRAQRRDGVGLNRPPPMKSANSSRAPWDTVLISILHRRLRALIADFVVPAGPLRHATQGGPSAPPAAMPAHAPGPPGVTGGAGGLLSLDGAALANNLRRRLAVDPRCGGCGRDRRGRYHL